MIDSKIHNMQIEQSVLVTLMTTQESYSTVENLLTENEFYATRHKEIFKAIVALDAKNSPYDLLLVKQHLETTQMLQVVGGEEYLMKIYSEASSIASNLKPYAEQLKNMSVCRSVEAQAQLIIRKAQSLTVSRSELVADAQSAFAQINSEQESESLFHIHDAAIGTYKEMKRKMELAAKGESAITGIQTGIYDLDKKLGDVEKGSLVVLAARPAMGKTTMLQTIASYVSIIQNKPTLIMSGEMPKEQIAMRLCCAIGAANIGTVRNTPHLLPREEFDGYQRAVAKLAKVPMEINDTSRPSISNIREALRKTKHKYGSLGAVFIDYLQIMKTTKQFAREDLKIAYFTGELKAMAKEFDCVVVLLSQLNRSLESRTDKRPMMSDLRESGAIEQDADQIIFLYRDEVYHKDSKFPSIAEAIVGKNRHGEIGTALMYSQLNYCQFSNLDSMALDELHKMEKVA